MYAVPYKRLCLIVAPLVVMMILGLSVQVVLAASGTATIAQGFKTTVDAGQIVTGAMVSTKAGTSDSAELTTTDNASRLVGVIDTKPLLTISNGPSQIQVVLSGSTQVLVSDINGQVKSGDRITASPIAGVGMRASADSQVVGVAQSDQRISGSESKQVKDRSGKNRLVHISSVPLQVGVAFYQAPGSNFLPPFIQNFANSIAGRPVSFIRVFLSGFILMAVIIVVVVLINTSAKNSIVSIGRNPMAASAIRRGLYQMIGVAMLVLAFGLLASYLMIRL